MSQHQPRGSLDVIADPGASAGIPPAAHFPDVSAGIPLRDPALAGGGAGGGSRNSSSRGGGDDAMMAAEEVRTNFKLSFYSMTKREILDKFRQEEDDASASQVERTTDLLFQDAEAAFHSPEFQAYANRWGMENNVAFERNFGADRAVHARFVQAFQELPDCARLALVFHGTYESNIPNIARDGLDPKRRRGQAYGPGEYFSLQPAHSVAYCHKGKKMLAFLVVLPSSIPAAAALFNTVRPTMRPPSDIAVVPTTEHQFPLGILTFGSVTQVAYDRSNAARLQLFALAQKLQRKTQLAETASAKAKIIQTLIRRGEIRASEVWMKHTYILDYDSRREISMWVHRRVDPNVIPFYFPNLPQPMSCEEHKMSDSFKTVEWYQEDMEAAKRELDKAERSIEESDAGSIV